MKKSLLNLALKIAKKKLSHHPEKDHFSHYSFVVQEDKILGFGMNHVGLPPVHYGYGRDEDDAYLPKTHSEISAWKKIRGILDKRKPFTVINIRLNRKGEVRKSKPCRVCLDILNSLGCNKVYFTGGDNDFSII